MEIRFKEFAQDFACSHTRKFCSKVFSAVSCSYSCFISTIVLRDWCNYICDFDFYCGEGCENKEVTFGLKWIYIDILSLYTKVFLVSCVVYKKKKYFLIL